MAKHSVPEHIRSDDSLRWWPGSCANGWNTWIQERLHYPRGSPKNGYCKSFNGRMCDELLIGEIFYTMTEAQVVIEHWRMHFSKKAAT